MGTNNSLSDALSAIIYGQIQKDQKFIIDANFSIAVLQVKSPLILSIQLGEINKIWEFHNLPLDGAQKLLQHL